MYVLEWWTVSAIARGLFCCLFPELWSNEGNKHQNNTQVSAETVRHNSTYIILFLIWQNDSINDDKNDDLYTSSPCLTRFSFCWWRHNLFLMTSQWPDNCDAIMWLMISNSLDINFIHSDILGRSWKKIWYFMPKNNSSVQLNHLACSKWEVHAFIVGSVTFVISVILCCNRVWKWFSKCFILVLHLFCFTSRCVPCYQTGSSHPDKCCLSPYWLYNNDILFHYFWQLSCVLIESWALSQYEEGLSRYGDYHVKNKMVARLSWELQYW